MARRGPMLRVVVLSLAAWLVHSRPADRRRPRINSFGFSDVQPSLGLLRGSLLGSDGDLTARLSGAPRLGGAAERLPGRRDAVIGAKAATKLAAGLAAVARDALEQGASDDARRPAAAPPRQSVCSAALEQLAEELQRGFDEDGDIIAQRGYVDFGAAHSGFDCASDGACAFSSPSTAYGLAVLPLSPGEDADAKRTHHETPQHAAIALDGRHGPGGMAPAWQLARGEVVALAGCTPPAAAARYFGATGYLYSTFVVQEPVEGGGAGERRAGQWLELFGSLGDTASLVGPPPRRNASRIGNASSSGGSPGAPAPVGRLNTSRSLPSAAQSGSGAAHDALTLVLLGADPRRVAAAAKASRAALRRAAARPANGTAAAALRAALADGREAVNVLPIPTPELGFRLGLERTSNYYALLLRVTPPSANGSSGALSGYLTHPHFAAWRLTPIREHAAGAGFPLAPPISRKSSAGTSATPEASGAVSSARRVELKLAALMADVIGDAASTLSPERSARKLLVQVEQQREQRQGQQLEQQQKQQGQQKQRQQQKLQQQQQALAVEALLDDLEAQLGSRYAVHHGLGSAAALPLLDVDWGLDCLRLRLDWCNGDNRDATYLSAMPLATLNRPGQVLLVVGADFVGAGQASYVNVAVTDPLAQAGLAAFDDGEYKVDRDVQGAARFVVAFARNCSSVRGASFPCREVATEGVRGAPLPRPLLVMARAYVNPKTGVGPDASELVPIRTLLLTPWAVAVPADSNPRPSGNTWGTDPPALAHSLGGHNDDHNGRHASNASDDDDTTRAAQLRRTAAMDERGADRRWSDATGNLSEAAILRATSCAHAGVNATNVTRIGDDDDEADGRASGWNSVGSAASDACVRSLAGMTQCGPGGLPDVCCGHVRSWDAADCWCRPSGRALMDATAPWLAPRKLGGLAWVCERGWWATDDEAQDGEHS